MDRKCSSICIQPRGDGGGGCGTASKCGRWNPTSEQVKVLTDLFRSGLRTPSTDQIQKISSQLSFYGKIESKNVFYWFQNHKARERQKRRRVLVEDGNHEITDITHIKLSTAKSFSETNKVSEPERARETLQLLPLNTFNETGSEKIRLFRVVSGRLEGEFEVYVRRNGESHVGSQIKFRLDRRL